MATQLNERFQRGGPSNDLAGVGVLVHQYDSYDDGNYRIPPWERCTVPWSCYRSSDRISAMSVSASSSPDPEGNWPLFSRSLAGMILSPSHNHLMCSYPYDAGTAERGCDPIGMSSWCLPGCTYFGDNRWCDDDRGWPCTWPADHLRESIEVRDRISRANGHTWERDAPWDFVQEGGFCALPGTASPSPLSLSTTSTHTLLACPSTTVQRSYPTPACSRRQ